MNFSEALELLKQGKKIRRNLPPVYILTSYIYLKDNKIHHYVKFKPNQYHPEGLVCDETNHDSEDENYIDDDDILADDWEVVDE